MTDAIIRIQGDQSAEILTENRNFILGTSESDFIFGTEDNDEILALEGDDRIFGSPGNDILDGGDGHDTADYSFTGQPITLLPRGAFDTGSGGGQLGNIEKIFGAPGQPNTIDGSGGTGSTSFDIDLEANRLVVNNVPGIGSLLFTVENFVNVTGTSNADTIVGSSANNVIRGSSGDDFLTGGAGDDTLDGGDGNDTLLGTNALARGVGERDTLTGEAGADRFILGDRAGSYYNAAGNEDFAQITDFSFGDQIQLSSVEMYLVQPKAGGFDLFVNTGGTQDLIADVRLTSGMSSQPSSKSSVDALLPELSSGTLTVNPAQATDGIFVFV